MSKTIVQKVVFKNTTPQQLYEMYVDSKKQTASTGMATKMSAKEGADFIACDEYVTGKNLRLIKNELIALRKINMALYEISITESGLTLLQEIINKK